MIRLKFVDWKFLVLLTIWPFLYIESWLYVYQLLYNYAHCSCSDGIIIGAIKAGIIKEISKLNVRLGFIIFHWVIYL